MILAGHGVLMSGAMQELMAFVEKTHTPVGLTLLGKGGFPESHPLALGMMGMHGEASVSQAIQEADLLLAFGMRFDDRVTGKLAAYAPAARRVHVDADAAELNKIVKVDVPYSVVTSGGLGTMGFGLPAAIGAKFGRPDREVWVVAGDGGFQMTMHDLGTIIQEKLPIHIALSNNNYLGMVRQWQEMFYDERYEATHLVNPDFVKLVEAYGIPTWRATTRAEARTAVEEAREVAGPTFIEFQIAQTGPQGNVYPMVAAGKALNEMIRRPHAVEETE